MYRRIGLVSVYAFRPHVEQLMYAASLLKEAGCVTYVLSCDSAVGTCYPRELRRRGAVRECSACVLGGVRSFPMGRVTGMSRRYRVRLEDSARCRLVESSAATLHRTETNDQLQRGEVERTKRRLGAAVEVAYGSAKEWIEDRQLDAVILFNGRMDLTAAVAQAAKDQGVPFLTMERTWFGHGLQLIPNANCLSLKASDAMTAAFRALPLDGAQARLAARQLALRFQRRNELEWRVYNRGASAAAWPGTGSGARVLIIPSSKNEFQGHAEWDEGWGDNTVALDQMIDHLGLSPGNCVVRCHPNWAERIGRVTGEHSASHYRWWARRRGVVLVESDSTVDTYDLLREADVAVLNGGSTAFEAAALGKPVLCLGPSKYQKAGISAHVNDPGQWGEVGQGVLEKPDHSAGVSNLLRFLYVQMRRFPQYVDYVRAQSTTRFRYFRGGDPDRLLAMLRTGHVEPDDASHAADDSQERAVTERIIAESWGELSRHEEAIHQLEPLPLQRHIGLRWMDRLRETLPRGDL